jgi:hypothetical protein
MASPVMAFPGDKPPSWAAENAGLGTERQWCHQQQPKEHMFYISHVILLAPGLTSLLLLQGQP